jgi:type IX secretion system PorP/SprF family membrane protein
LFIILFIPKLILAQYPIFSQPSTGNVNLNPALAGNDSSARLAVNYRNQWPNLSSNYVTTSLNFYQYLPKLNAYAGIDYLYDNQARGTLQTHVVSAFYSQNININKILIRPSLAFSFGSKKLDGTRLNFGDMIDARRGFVYLWNPEYPSEIKKKYLDFTVGAIANYKNFIIGISSHHNNQPDVGVLGKSKLPRRYGVQFGYTLNLKKISVAPYAYFIKQQNFEMLTVGTNVTFIKHITVGAAYRTSDAVILNVGYQNKWLALNYSYDVLQVLYQLVLVAHTKWA